MGRSVFKTYRVCRLVFLVVLLAAGQHAIAQEKHFLYVAVPGIRNYVEFGGIGILIFDIDNGYRFVKRIPTWVVPPGKHPENVKGIAASAKTGKLYVSTMNRLAAFDVHSEKKVWDRPYEGGCDRMAISRDGQTLYVPSFEGPFWNVVNAATGAIITKIQTNSGAHNTIASPDGTRVYLAGLHSPLLSVADGGPPFRSRRHSDHRRISTVDHTERHKRTGSTSSPFLTRAHRHNTRKSSSDRRVSSGLSELKISCKI